MRHFRLRALAFAAGVALLSFSGWASADPPARVARLGYLNGAVSFSPAGESDWVGATINRPLTTGDRLWSDRGARAEIQVGGAMIRMHANTGVTVLNLDDRIAQLQLTQGTLNVRVRRLDADQVFEVDTPNLAFTLRQPGEYRIEVDPDGSATLIVVRKGQGEAYGEGASYVIDSAQPYRFTGTDLRDYQDADTPRLDEFDRWSRDRDRAFDNSVSARYVSRDVVGHEDLDANGSWRVDASYGNVWIPNRVAVGWAPYRDGHWAWVDPWGWTWVDDAPWGFAVSHYGRWANLRGTWGWVPGPPRAPAYYAPALVAFVGGSNFQLTISSGSVGAVAWFPLGPREVYRPSYAVSRGYFENVNRSNTVVNTTIINNTYNTTNVTNVVYANRHVPGAVVAVPTTTFVQSQPVSRAAVKVSREMMVSAPVAAVAPVAPTQKSVRGAGSQGDKPPARVFERPVVARTAPPAAHAGFAAQQQQLAAKPGKPLDDVARKEIQRAPAASAPVVKVIAQKQEPPPTQRPPPAARSAKGGDAADKSNERKAGAESAIGGASGVPARVAAPTPAAPPAKAADQPEPRAKPEPLERGVMPSPTPPQAALPPAVPAVTVPPAQSGEPHGKADQRANADPRERVGAAPPARRASEPKAAPRQVALPPAAAAEPKPAASAAVPSPTVAASQPAEQRGKAQQRADAEQRGRPATPLPAPHAPAPRVTQPQAADSAAVVQAPAQPVPSRPPQARPATPVLTVALPASAARRSSQPARADAVPPAAAPEPASSQPLAAPKPALPGPASRPGTGKVDSK